MAETKIKLSIDGVQTVVSGMKQVTETVGDVASSLTALTAIGGALSIGAFATMVKGAIDAADNLNDLSKTTNISVSELAGLKMAAQQSGTELDSVAKAVNKLSVNMGKDAEKFAAVGISAKEPIEAFKQLADITKSLHDPQQKAAFLTEVLGKSWESVAPLLNEGSEKIGQMVEQGSRLAGVNQDMADQSDAFNDALVVLDTAMGGFKTRLAADMLPLLNVLVGDFADTAEKTRDLTGSFNPLTETLRALVVLGGNVSFVFKGIGTEIGGIGAQIAALATGDIAGFLAIGDMMKNDAKSAREAFDAWEKRVMEAGPQITKQAEEVDAELERIRARSAAANAARVRDFISGNEAAKKAAADAKKAAAEVHREQQAQAKLTAELSGLTGDFAEKWDRLNKMYAAGKLSVDRLTEAQAKLLAQQPAIKKANDEELRQAKLIAEEWEDAAKARADYDKQYGDKLNTAIRGVNEYGQGIEENNRRTEFEIRLMGKTAEARALALAQYQIQLDLEREILRIKELGLDAADAEQQIARARTYAVQASAGAAMRAELDQWNTTWSSVDRTAHDTFVSIFDSGKNAFDRLEDTLKNGLLDLLYQMTVRQWIFSIGATVSGMPGGAQAGVSGGGSSGLMGILNNASSVNSAYSMGVRAADFFGFGASTSSTIAGGVEAAYAASNAGYAAASYEAATLAAAETFGAAAGTEMAAVAGTELAAGAAGTSSIMSSLSALGPYAAVAAAIYMIVSSMDDSGTLHSGGAGQAAKGGSFAIDARALGTMTVQQSDAANKNAQGIAAGLVTILDATAETFGKQAGYSAATAFADDTSKDGAWGALRIELMGQKVTDWQDTQTSRWAPREYADGEQGRAEYMMDLGTSLKGALMAMDLPGWAQNVLSALGATPSVEQLGQAIETINQAQTAFESVGGAIKVFATLTDSATSALVQASGGLGNLVANLNSYYAGYYTEAEKIAKQTADVNAELAKYNLALPTSRMEYRAMTEAQLALGEAGAPAAAALLRLSGIAGTIIDYGNKVAETPIGSGTAASDDTPVFEDTPVHNETPALNDTAVIEDTGQAFELTLQYLRLIGKETEALEAERARELALLPESARGVQELVHARLRENEAAEKAATRFRNAMTLVDRAFGAVQRAVDAERKTVTAAYQQTMTELADRIGTVTGSISKLTTLSSTLKSTINGMRLESQSSVDRASAQAQIMTALAIAKASGVLPDAESLQNALSVVSQPNEQLFGSFEDAQRDFLITRNMISELAGLTDSALTVEQQTLKALEAQKKSTEEGYKAEMERLDGILGAAQQQIDALNGINTKAGSIAETIAGLSGALVGAAAVKPASAADTTGSTVAGLYAAFAGKSAAQIDAEGAAYWAGRVASGESMASIKQSFQDSVQIVNARKGLAVGTNRVPYDMFTKIHKDERVIPAADNRELMARLREPVSEDSSTAIVLAIRKLDERLENIETNTGRSADGSEKTAEVLGRSSAGGPLLVEMAT